MVGPGMARVAGEVADVVMPHGGIMSDKYMREVLLPAIRAGMHAVSGRTWNGLGDRGEWLSDPRRERPAKSNRKRSAMRRALSFYGSTRTYHKVLALHGLEELGHASCTALSLQGKWEAMRDTVTRGRHPRTWRKPPPTTALPQFLAEHREYATRTGLGVPRETPEQEERFQDLRKRVFRRLRTRACLAGWSCRSRASSVPGGRRTEQLQRLHIASVERGDQRSDLVEADGTAGEEHELT